MTLNEYQIQAAGSAIYPNRNSFNGLCYVTLKMNGEAGEIAEHVGKAIRDDRSSVTMARYNALVKECGDVLWYVAAMAYELNLTLDDIAKFNLLKLADRKERGVLGGSGDER